MEETTVLFSKNSVDQEYKTVSSVMDRSTLYSSQSGMTSRKGPCCCSFTKSCLTLWPHGLQHPRLLCPPPSPLVCSNLYPLSRTYCLTISISASFFFCLQSFPASGSFLMSQLFASDGQSIGASALASVLPMNIQGWFPSGWAGLISLQSKGLSGVFSRTTIRRLNECIRAHATYC